MNVHTVGHRRWKRGETIDVSNEAEVRNWARRLHLTPNELREMIDEVGDRSARVATEVGLPLQSLLP